MTEIIQWAALVISAVALLISCLSLALSIKVAKNSPTRYAIERERYLSIDDRVRRLEKRGR